MSPSKCVIVLSGKRKSGKDFIANEIVKILSNEKCSVIRLSEPLKGQYAKIHGLDLKKLLDSSSYKELYREKMIVWGEEMRRKDSFYFVRLAEEMADKTKPVWVVSDARRISDVNCLKEIHGERLVIVRVEATDEIRKSRGWIFTLGIDDCESECGLDGYQCFDLIIKNNSEPNFFFTQLNQLITLVERKLEKLN